MRDQHRNKRGLVQEVTDLRKQVADLKQAAVERRRVEDRLRRDGELLRALLDQAPHPHCLLTREGVPLLANRSFVELMGYASQGELVRIAGDLGLVVADSTLGAPVPMPQPTDVTYRRSDGARLVAPTVSTAVPGTDYLALTVLTNRQLA
jgi:PAS domain-containing protein